MNTAEVEKSHVEIHGGCQMLQRLAESKTQPSEAAKVCSHAQVGAFDMACADMRQLRNSADWDGHNGFYGDGVVPLRASDVRPAVNLDELREVNVRAVGLLNRGDVPAEAVRSDLKPPYCAFAQVADKIAGRRCGTLPDKIGQHHFRLGINRHPNIVVAPFFRAFAEQVGLFGMNERPKLVGLDVARMNVAHAGIEKVAAFFPNGDKQRKNRTLMNARHAGNGAHAHSFEQKLDDLRGLFGRDIVASKRLMARLSECRFASGATVTLDSATSVEAKSFCFVVVTADTSHVGFSLVFLLEKPDNQSLGSECGLRPRLDSALPLAETRGRAFLFELENYRIVTSSTTENFSLLDEPLQSRKNSSEWLRVRSEVESGVFQTLPDLTAGKPR